MSKLPPVDTDEDGRRIYAKEHLRKFKSACKALSELYDAGAEIISDGVGNLYLFELTEDERQANPNLESKKLGAGYSASIRGTYLCREDVASYHDAGVFYSNTIE